MSKAQQQKLEKVKNYCFLGTIAMVVLLTTITYLWAMFVIDTQPESLESSPKNKHETTTQMSVKQVKHSTEE